MSGSSNDRPVRKESRGGDPDDAGNAAWAYNRNIELKARLRDLESARQIAMRIATARLGTQHQVDTYFQAPRSRLKLRQIDGLSAQLVAYCRPDLAGPKASDYQLVPVANPESLKLALAASLGIRVVVEKRREIFLWHNVRIHLDQVSELGAFIEFEAVLGPDADNARGHAQITELRRLFELSDADVLDRSYSDLLLARGSAVAISSPSAT